MPKAEPNRLNKFKAEAWILFWKMAAAERSGKPADTRKLYDTLTVIGQTPDDFERAVQLIERRAQHRAMIAKEPAIEKLMGDFAAEIATAEAVRRRVTLEIDMRIDAAAIKRSHLESHLGEVGRARDALAGGDAIPAIRQRLNMVAREALALSIHLGHVRDDIASMEHEARVDPRQHGRREQAIAAVKRSAEIALPMKRAELAEHQPVLAEMEEEMASLEALLLKI